MQFVESRTMIPSFNTLYHFGVDGFAKAVSLFFDGLITPMASFLPGRSSRKNRRQYFAAFLILEGLMIVVFRRSRAAVLCVLEAMLIPMFIIIGVWADHGACTPTIKFFCILPGRSSCCVALIYFI